MAEQELEQATAREDLCRFLAACYYEPEPMLAEEAVFESLQAAAVPLSPELAESAGRVGAAFAAQDLQELLLDYTRLFLGPPSALAKPYGSVWLEGEARVMGESTAALEDLYREAGFEVDAALHEPPDHMALELEFLYLLTFQCNDARRLGDAAASAAWEQRRAAFLRRHLGAWAGPFTEAVRSHAGTAFYRELAALTALFLRQECERLPAT